MLVLFPSGAGSIQHVALTAVKAIKSLALLCVCIVDKLRKMSVHKNVGQIHNLFHVIGDTQLCIFMHWKCHSNIKPWNSGKYEIKYLKNMCNKKQLNDDNQQTETWSMNIKYIVKKQENYRL